MKAPAHYHTLRAACLPLIEYYQTDLLVHDRRIIRRNPEVPFLHVTRDYGSYLTMLPGPDKYPAEGEMVPYLFDKADRWHLLKERSGCIEYAEKHHPHALVHYFDGKHLRTVTYPQARRIIEEYRQSIIAAWLAETPAWKRDGFEARLRRSAA